MNVYTRNKEGKLSKFNVETEDHEDAILRVKEDLVENHEPYYGAVLASIPKKEKLCEPTVVMATIV